MGLAENVIQWLLSSLNICVWMWEESVCLCVFVHVDLCMCIRQLFLRPVAREAASARSNLLAWRCRIWYFLRLWPNITRSLIQHSSLIPSIPCIPFLHSLHCHHLTAAPSPSPCTGHFVATPPYSLLRVSQPQQQLGSTCSWSALLLCLAVAGCCNWVTGDRGQLFWPENILTQAKCSFSKSCFTRKIKLLLLCSLYRERLVSLREIQGLITQHRWNWVHFKNLLSKNFSRTHVCRAEGQTPQSTRFVTFTKIGKHMRTRMMILNSHNGANPFTIK